MNDDLISRQAVLDGIEELKKTHFDRVVVLNKVRDRVLDLSSVNPQEPKTDVLDKILAEIEALSNANPSYWHSGDMVEREEVFEIIDKYKAESEDKE